MNNTVENLTEAAPTQAGASNRRDWKFHAERINAAWGKQASSIIETGRYLIEAHDEMERASFEAMVQQELTFDPSAARKLIIIAQNPILTNCAHGHKWPPSWTTLYELAKLPLALLQKKLADGSIHPRLERREVAVWRGKKAKRRQSSALAARDKEIAALKARVQELEADREMGAQPLPGTDSKQNTRAIKFTPERIRQIKNLLERGMSREEIAELIGVTAGSLQVTCSRLGISLRKPQNSDAASHNNTGSINNIEATILAVQARNAELENQNLKLKSELEDAKLARKPTIARKDKTALYCSCCNKSQHDVGALVAWPKVHICDGCVDLCVNILAEQSSGTAPPPPNAVVPAPTSNPGALKP